MLYHYIHQFLGGLIHFLLTAFFVVLAFFVPVFFLGAFFAAEAALLPLVDDAFEAAVDDEAAAAAGFEVVALDFAAAFFFGDAAFFFGLFALAPDFAFVAFDFGLAVLAFFAPVAGFFLLAVVADDDAIAAGTLEVVAELLLPAAAAAATAGAGEAVAAFLLDAFFAGDAERFRFVPVADFGLLAEGDFLPADFLPPPGVFDRLRGLADADFFAGEAFFFPAAEPVFAAVVEECTLKLPLAPTPFVCFSDLFFVPARKADLRC